MIRICGESVKVLTLVFVDVLTYCHQGQDGQHGPDEISHPSNMTTLELNKSVVEISRHAAEDEDESHLNTNTRHIDLLSEPNVLGVFIVG